MKQISEIDNSYELVLFDTDIKEILKSEKIKNRGYSFLFVKQKDGEYVSIMGNENLSEPVLTGWVSELGL